MFATESRICVRYKETDQMGVVHHSNYYIWFEVGRSDFLKELGLNYRELEQRGLMLPVLETHCTYKQSARYDDQVIIRTKLTELKGVRLTMAYEAIRERDKALLAYGSTVHAFTDNNLKPINLKKAFPDIYDVFIKCLEK